MQKILIFLFASLLQLCYTSSVDAQSTKWFKKARKAQVTLIAYDANGQILNSTNGFFVGTDGTVLTDYKSLRGAARIVAIDEKDHELKVTHVLGANALYDVARLHVEVSKPAGLTLASTQALKGESVFILPYLSNKSGVTTAVQVEAIQPFADNYAYYTLPVTISEKSLSCPVMNASGELLGLLQMSAKADEKKCYAISADYVMSLKVTALSATSADYRDLLIRKQLPDEPSQANSFIYLIGTRDTALYLAYTDDFIARFPTETSGYTMKAEMLTAQQRFAEADETWTNALKMCSSTEDEIHYSRARSIFGAIQAHQSGLPETWTLEQSLTEIEAASANKPQAVYTALKAHILYAQQRYGDACQSFLEVTQTPMRSSEYFLYAAQCQQMLRDTTAVLVLQDSAMACFTKPYVVEAAPALLIRSQTLLSLGRNREAVIDLMDYEHLKPNDVNANFYYQREQAELRCRMFQQALSDIERAVRMAPREPLYQAELASVHYRFGNIDEAIIAAQAAIALDDTFADAHRILGVCLRQQGKEKEAQAAFQRAADLGDEMAKTLKDAK